MAIGANSSPRGPYGFSLVSSAMGKAGLRARSERAFGSGLLANDAKMPVNWIESGPLPDLDPRFPFDRVPKKENKKLLLLRD